MKKNDDSSCNIEDKIKNKDLYLLTDLNAALQKEKHKGLFFIVVLLFVFCILFIVWAYFSRLDEVTRGQGSVIPSSREQIIQTLDPGVLEDMLVKEGDIVEKGQILLKLNDTRSAAILKETRAKIVNLQAIYYRLKSEAYSIPLNFPEDTPSDLIERETSVYNIKKDALETSVFNLKKSKSLLDKEISMTKPIVSKGAMSEVELLRMQRQSSDIQLQIDEKLNKYLTEASSELVRTESELAQAKENVIGREDVVERSRLRSPLKGVVKNIRINTIGGVISAGQNIMEITPLEDQLLIESYINPRDVAYVRVGMPALVKLSAYDYAIYGGLEGVVTLVSPGTLHDQKRPTDLKLDPNEAYYRVLVQTNANSLVDKNGNDLPVIPGMIANVDIKTGEKTVFQYLIKPITRMKQSLQER
ncbi:membrane spanning export protein [Escherichia coli]|uniref:HlyD family efflux transporter periplasmic adaptor subunit n=1 Tax=Escherichia coli TaxID=562 RepID=UPI0019196545|nr:HlyD family efflux transporter periplasmic adaptor subunit [Escherichia coli]CAD5757982.1 membrane spanning export protein [Escherichia coli]